MWKVSYRSFSMSLVAIGKDRNLYPRRIEEKWCLILIVLYALRNYGWRNGNFCCFSEFEFMIKERKTVLALKTSYIIKMSKLQLQIYSERLQAALVRDICNSLAIWSLGKHSTIIHGKFQLQLAVLNHLLKRPTNSINWTVYSTKFWVNGPSLSAW